jgi:hypothetical protein
MTDHFFDRLGAPCPEETGTRIRLLSMPDDPDPVPIGSTGTVRGGNGAQMYVDWDNGRSLILVVDVDRYEVIE